MSKLVGTKCIELVLFPAAERSELYLNAWVLTRLIQNATAGLQPPYIVTSPSRSFHWLPLVMTYKAINSMASPYPQDMIQPFTCSHTLR